ncbi:insulinase family protein, partial [candidate division WOR-3 bacterium]|nr:insulinase family protein [candidate division WOR-3 bacterium]
PSGLVVISERIPHIRSVALGLSFRTGGRDDPEGKGGIAHMIEHMVFRGTRDKDVIAINIAAESHGAELNAFTDKETTCFYGRFPGDQFGPVTALMAETVNAPAFRAEELAKEKEVISEEIRTSQEDPDTIALNLLFRALYGEHGMGRPIVGTIDSVNGQSDDDLRERYAGCYGPACGVAVAVGDVEHGRLADSLVSLLDTRRACRSPSRTPAAIPLPNVLVETRNELSQVYLCLARPGLVYSDPRRHALAVLNMALGGGVSSRLFQRLREQEALVYSVGSFAEQYSDSGLLGVYLVTDHRKLARCVTVLREEFARLRCDRLTDDEFERARNMTKSSVLLALESTSTRMMRLARAWQLLGRAVTVDETVEAYNRLTRADVESLLDELLAADFEYCGAVGPLSEDAVRKTLDA